MPFEPMFDRIVIEPIEQKEQKIGLLYAPPSGESPYGLAKILKVGPGIYLPDGNMRPLHARPGEIILYNKTTTLPFDGHGEAVKFICERDIVAKYYSVEEAKEANPDLLNESEEE